MSVLGAVRRGLAAIEAEGRVSHEYMSQSSTRRKFDRTSDGGVEVVEETDTYITLRIPKTRKPLR